MTPIIQISNKSTIPIEKWTEIYNSYLTSMIDDLPKVKGEYSRIKLVQLVLEVLSLTFCNYRQIRYIETPINTKLYPKFISNGKLYGRYQ